MNTSRTMATSRACPGCSQCVGLQHLNQHCLYLVDTTFLARCLSFAKAVPSHWGKAISRGGDTALQAGTVRADSNRWEVFIASSNQWEGELER